MASSIWATGSCLCGQIKYALTEQPKNNRKWLCHCVMCKKASGSAFMTNWWMQDDVLSITQGKELLKEYSSNDTKSGNTAIRSFCRECGSPLFLRTTNPASGDRVGITAGTLDFDKDIPREGNVALNWSPNGELFTKDRVMCFSSLAGVSQHVDD